MSLARHLSRTLRDRQGFIVVAALWILAALAALASIYSIYVANAAISISVNDESLQAEAMVKASLELTAFHLLNEKEKDRPTRGQFAFRMGKASANVDFCSEAARVDLNMASKDLLAGLFTALGASADQAEQYADRVIGWRTAPSAGSADKEGSLYRAAGLSYGPRGGPFAHIGELALVLDLPPAMVERAMPYVTVYSGRAQVNVLDADPAVVAALPGMTPTRLAAFLKERTAIAPHSALTDLGTAQNMVTTEGSKATRVSVRVRFDDGRQIASEVVILLAGSEEPYRVLSWQDDADGPMAANAGQGAVRR